MRALLLTNHFYTISGSEIVLLEIYEVLTEKGFHVELASFVIEDRFKKLFEEKNIKYHQLFVDKEPEIQLNDFDLIWSQHSCLNFFDFKKIVSDKRPAPIIIRSCLSPYENLERPLTEIDYFGNLEIACNSPETQKACHEIANGEIDTRVFYNACPDIFFQQSAKRPSKIEKILVVSNHMPQELLDTIKMLRKQGTKVTIFGRQEKIKRITAKDIQLHDAVISIGKTVQYSLVGGKPVYLYDHFGGDGWVTKSNINLNMEYNFSGRPYERKISAEEIFNEINNDYASALYQLDAKTLDKFRLSKFLDHYITYIYDTNYRMNIYKTKLEKAASYQSKSRLIGQFMTEKYNLQRVILRDVKQKLSRVILLSNERRQTIEKLNHINHKSKENITEYKHLLSSTRQTIDKYKHLLSNAQQTINEYKKQHENLFNLGFIKGLNHFREYYKKYRGK